MTQQIDGINLPYGYQAWADGLYSASPPPKDMAPEEPALHAIPSPTYRGACLEKIAQAPMWISRYADTVGSDEHWLELSELDPREPDNRKCRWIDRGVMASAQRLAGLALYGFRVHSENARELIRYFAAQEQANTLTLPRIRISKRVGFVDDSRNPSVRGWLFGREWIGPAAYPTVVAPGSVGVYEHAFRTQGDLEEWAALYRRISKAGGRVARWLIWVSFAAPLLRLLDERTFIVHHYGASSAGKSALAKFALSAWGAKELKLSLNRTAKSFLGPFQQCTDLPVVFDEFQSLDPETRKQLGLIIYQITEEQQRAGLNVDGTNRQLGESFRSVVRFTGEQNMIGEGAAIADLGGQANRVLQFQAAVLDEDTASDVNKWVGRGEHFGHAGRRFLLGLSKVIANPDAVSELQKLHWAARDAIEAKIGKQGRVGSLAAVVTAEVLGHRWILGTEKDLPFEVESLSESNAFQWAVEDAAAVVDAMNSDPSGRRTLADQIVQFLRDHRMAQHDQYVETQTDAGRAVLQTMSWRKVAGFVRHLPAEKMTEIIYPSLVINEALEAANLPVSRVWPELRRAGLLVKRQSDNRLAQSVRLPHVTGVGPQRCYVVRLPLLDQPEEDL